MVSNVLALQCCGKVCYDGFRSSQSSILIDAMSHTMLVLAVVGMLQVLVVLPLSGAVIAEDPGNPSAATSDPLLTTECEQYNRSSCLTNGTDCSGTQQCLLHNISIHARCFVLWRNSSEGKDEVETKGCIYADATCSDQTECVAKHEHNRITPDQPHFYCCCNSNNCNRKFSREPIPEPVQRPPSSPDHNVLLMVLCPLGSLIVIGVIVTAIFYCYRKSKMAPYFHPLPAGSCSGVGAGGGSDCTAATNASLTEVDDGVVLPESVSQHTAVSSLCPPVHRPVQLLQVKAKGRFGALWMATCNGDHVAVKIFPASDYNSWNVEKKVYGLPQLRHPNILEFMGVEKHGDNLHAEYWLISAYHYRGSLSDYLKANSVSWTELRHIAHSMARGLCFLHEEQPANAVEAAKPIIAHRDFKSKNVLLKADLTACVADFGLAIVFYQGQSPGETHGQVGTRRYMAPEVLEGAISFQADAFLRIDMYAMGLVLWELLSRCTDQQSPIGSYKLPFEEEVGYHPTLDDMQECVVVQKCRPVIKKQWLRHTGMELVVSTMEECWDHDSEARLTAACVMERLSSPHMQLPAEEDVSPGPQQHVSSSNSVACNALPLATTMRSALHHSLSSSSPASSDVSDVKPHHTSYMQSLLPLSSCGTVTSCQQSDPPNAANLAAVNYACVGNVNISRVPPHLGNGVMPHGNNNTNYLPSINVSKMAPMRYANGYIGRSHLYNSTSPSTQFSSSGSRGSSSSSGGGYISHHSALSNQIPRPVASSKQMMLPSVNVPIPHSPMAVSASRLPPVGLPPPLPAVSVPMARKQEQHQMHRPTEPNLLPNMSLQPSLMPEKNYQNHAPV